jgi:tRNA threonylcarbamoyladenosine biosynthesis protein TsaE
MHRIEIPTLDHIQHAAAEFLKTIGSNRIIAFYGEMGAGKTTFIKALCKQMGVIETTNSPTFALIYEYHTKKKETIYHFDFYRINKIEEVFDLGYEDYFFSGNYCFMEWPEKVETILPAETVKVKICVNPDNSRTLEI